MLSFEALDIEPQTAFPLVDLTEKNAETLLRNFAGEGELERTHTLAEQQRTQFQAAHPALRDTASRAFPKYDPGAPEQGILAYEAVAVAVFSMPGVVNFMTMRSHIQALRTVGNMTDVRHAFFEGYADFCDHLPRTAEVVTRSVRRFHPEMSREQIVLGAAIARQFQLATISELE